MHRDLDQVLKDLRGFLMNEARNVGSIAMSLRISTRRLAPFHQDSRVVALERGIEDALEALWNTRAAIVDLAKPLPAREVGEKKPAPRRRRRKADRRADDVDTKGDE
jgi:hypothetical protein